MTTLRFMLVFVVLASAGCARSPVGQQSFATADGRAELRFPADWTKSQKKNPYDLQCFSADERMTTGVFVYVKDDLAEDVAPEKLLQQQVEDLRSKRTNFKLLEAQQVVQMDQQKLTSVVYAGEKDSSRNYYRFTLIEFKSHPEIFVVALQVAVPSSWSQAKPVLEEITSSARVIVEKGN